MARWPEFEDRKALAKFHKRLQVRSILSVICAAGTWFAVAGVYVLICGKPETIPTVFSFGYGLFGLALIFFFRWLIAGTPPNCPHCHRPIFTGARDEPAVITGNCPNCLKPLTREDTAQKAEEIRP